MEIGASEGESPVMRRAAHGSPFVLESRRLGILRKTGGKFHPNLNITQRPIAEKYCEGKLKRITKVKLKVPEIVSREPFGGKRVWWATVYCGQPDKGEDGSRIKGWNGEVSFDLVTTALELRSRPPGQERFQMRLWLRVLLRLWGQVIVFRVLRWLDVGYTIKVSLLL